MQVHAALCTFQLEYSMKKADNSKTVLCFISYEHKFWERLVELKTLTVNVHVCERWPEGQLLKLSE